MLLENIIIIGTKEKKEEKKIKVLSPLWADVAVGSAGSLVAEIWSCTQII